MSRLPRLGVGSNPQKLTTAQRDAISSPATGLVIYNTTTNLLNVYDGTSWGTVMPTVDTAGEGGVFVPQIHPAEEVIATQGVASKDDVRTFQFILPIRIKVGKVVIEIQTSSAVGSGNDVCGVGIYDKDKKLLLETGSLSTGSTGIISTTLGTPVTLEPGVYYSALTLANSTAKLRATRTGASSLVLSDFMNENGTRIGTAANSASPVGVLPGTLGAITKAALHAWVIYLEP